MKKIFIVLLFLLGCDSSGDVFFENEKFTIEYALTNSQKEKGLMFRDNLCEKCGMLFDFNSEQKVRMWMKNTKIPLDMVFMNSKKTVVFIAKNTIPNSTNTISTLIPTQYVLELNAGSAQKYGIKIGSIMRNKK